MGKFKQLASETAIYGLSSIIGKAINFILVPFYTSTAILKVEEYGIVTELYSYVAVLNVLYLYGMETAYFRFTSKSKHGEQEIYSNVFSSILITTVLLTIFLVSSATPIVNWLEFQGHERYVYWFAAIIAIDSLMAIPFIKLRYERKAKQFATFKLVNIFLNLGLNLFFLYFCKSIWEGTLFPQLKGVISYVYNPDYNVEYVFISNLIANACYILLLYGVIKKAKLVINSTVLQPMLIYAFPLLLSQLAGNFNEMFSRMMLKKILPDGYYTGFNNQEALGIFGACYKISMIMTLAIQAFRYAAEPFFFREAQAKDSKETYANVFLYFGIFGLFSVLAISLNLDVIKLIFLRDEAYWTALHIVPILLMASLFLGLYYNLSIWFKIEDKTYFGTMISVSAAFITVAMNFLLIPHFGYEGSVATTLFVYLYMCLFAYFTGKRHYPINYNIKKIGLYLVFTLFLLVIGWNLKHSSKIISQLLKEIPILIFIAVAYMSEWKKLKLNKN
ncbi:MAG: polysaccharide biosynthesis C-terminal domain-containing protein [Cyclobacteriaceae bacterium]|nr:polysaccharide biosynthesis C-terminal domain-containing protein [Cyclobacteriaceae bacterium]